VSNPSPTPDVPDRPPFVTRWIANAFSLDVRALAFLRITLGILLVWIWFSHLGVLGPLFTDDGVFSRAARMEIEQIDPYHFNGWIPSLQMLGGSLAWQLVLWGIAIVSAFFVLVGFRTKISLFVSYILLFGLHERFPAITQGGDVLFRLMIFWAMFLPLDQVWSRSHGDPSLPRRGTVVSFGTAGLILQLGLMYTFTALLKTSPIWQSEFSAAYYALAHGHYTNEFGQRLLAFPDLLKFGTMGAYFLELIVPAFLLLPVMAATARIFVVSSMILFHLGLALCMTLGTFPWICIACWVCVLPSPFWNRVHWFLTRDEMPEKPGMPMGIGSWVQNLIAAFLIVYVVLLNVRKLENSYAQVGTPPLCYLAKATGLEQCWLMFAPHPVLHSRYVLLEGHLADGRVVNLLHPGQPFAESIPEAMGTTFPNQYWRRCAATMFEFDEPIQQKGFADYFARQWNASHAAEDRVVRVRMAILKQITPPPDASRGVNPQPDREDVLDVKVD
jgi:Vitamin K-dependent gamma-carboxylase